MECAVTRTTHSTNGKIGELEIMPGGETAILDRRQFGRYRAALTSNAASAGVNSDGPQTAALGEPLVAILDRSCAELEYRQGARCPLTFKGDIYTAKDHADESAQRSKTRSAKISALARDRCAIIPFYQK